jgi:hypothetical protein
MTIIKNHFEVFLVTSKKQGNGIIESKVGLYSIKASSHICQSNYLFIYLFFRIPPPPGGTAILPEYIHYYGYYYQVIVQCLST